jgi:hypothetical protein
MDLNPPRSPADADSASRSRNHAQGLRMAADPDERTDVPMTAFTPARTPMHAPNHADARRSLTEARRLFTKALAGWASDALVLRQRGIADVRWTCEGECDALGQAA